MALTILYHTGFQEIRRPDIHVGRPNADFGQGFYLSPDEAFSRRWARTRKGQDTWLNVYALDADHLRVKILRRDAEWYDYILHNRTGYRDSQIEYDVITGPIANDTIYDIWGITTGGVLKPGEALQILSTGPEYIQTVMKTEQAAAQLRFLSAQIIPQEEISSYQEIVRQEEADYQNAVSDMIKTISEAWDDEA